MTEATQPPAGDAQPPQALGASAPAAATATAVPPSAAATPAAPSQPSAAAPPPAPVATPPRPETAGKGPATANPADTPAAAPPAAPTFVVPDAPDAPAVTPHTAPLLVLEALLNKVAALDPNGFFEAPVSELVAPGYFNVIKRPMCFQAMRARLGRREYRTWRSFVEDFELICSNATTYNQRRSKIHKAAATMLRAGKKLLQSAELEGRKAVALLHPDGPVAAALEEEREATALGTAAAVAWPAGAVVKAEPVAPGAPPGPAAGPPSLLPPGYEALLAEGEAGGGGEGYSSFSDTDLEEEDPKDAPPDPLLQQNLSAADWQPWPWAPNREAAGEGSEPKLLRSGRSARWKAARRGLEWRYHWLQLRSLELGAQVARYEDLVGRFAGDPPAPGGAEREAGGAEDGKQRPPHRRRPRRAGHAPGLPTLRQHPFFAHHLFGELPAELGARLAAESGGGGGREEEAGGSEMFAAFQVLSGRLAQLKGLLSQRGSRGGGGLAAKLARPPSGAAELRGPPKRNRSNSSLQPGSPPFAGPRFKGSAPSALRIPGKSEASAGASACASKRRRSDQEGEGGAGRVVPSVEISVPPVREIGEREWSRREAVLEQMRQLTSVAGLAAAATPLGGATIMGNGSQARNMEALLAEAMGPDGAAAEGSSSEDTDDECYLRRHHVMEIRERERFNSAGATGGGAQRQSRPPSGHLPAGDALRSPPTVAAPE
eukprot:jgi/Tetstr1/441180/TSEL_029438.t1